MWLACFVITVKAIKNRKHLQKNLLYSLFNLFFFLGSLSLFSLFEMEKMFPAALAYSKYMIIKH